MRDPGSWCGVRYPAVTLRSPRKGRFKRAARIGEKAGPTPPASPYFPAFAPLEADREVDRAELIGMRLRGEFLRPEHMGERQTEGPKGQRRTQLQIADIGNLGDVAAVLPGVAVEED